MPATLSCQRCHSLTTSSPDRSRKERQCKTRTKTEGGGAGECRKGQSSPDTFLSSSLYKVKCCLRFIAAKRKVNHIINKKKKSNYSLWWSNIAYNKSLTYKDLNLLGSSVMQWILSHTAVNMKPVAPDWACIHSKSNERFPTGGKGKGTDTAIKSYLNLLNQLTTSITECWPAFPARQVITVLLSSLERHFS